MEAIATSEQMSEVFPPRTVYRPEGLRRAAASLADARNTPTNILYLGDSTTFGIGADASQATTDSTGSGLNAPDQLRKRYNALTGNIDAGQIVLPSDSRCTRTSSQASISTGAFGTTSYRVDGAGSQIVFPSLRATSIDIIMDWHPTVSGQFRYSVDGAADVTPSAHSGTASGTIYVRTASGLDPAVSHTITIKAPTDVSKRGIIIGLRYRNESGVSVLRVGKPGATTADVIQGSAGATTAAGEYRRLLMLCTTNAFEPDLMVLKLGINDLGLPGAGQAQAITPAAFKANLKQIAQYVTDPATAADAEFNGSTKAPLRRTTGGSVLLVMGPHAATVGTTPESAYWDAAREVCDEMDHVSYINLADWYGSFAEAHDASLNLQLSGSVHSNSRGYGRDADIIFSALNSSQVIGVG
jgi:lysophospholipase L1-like esterase